MSEFDSLADELVHEARNEEVKQRQRDLSLISKVLEIYDQKFVAELLRKLGNADWTRETLNLWSNGKCGPRSLTVTEAALLEKMLPQPVVEEA